MADSNSSNTSRSGPSAIETIPVGQYEVVITGGEIKPYQNGAGHYLLLTFQITEGPHKGHLLWRQLNLNHPNPITRAIASEELNSICRAVGLSTLQDYTELYNRPLMIDVCCRTYLDDGTVTNRIAGYQKNDTSQTLRAAT